MSNSKVEEKEKTNRKEEKATRRDNGKSMTERTISIEDSKGKEGRTIY